MNVFLHPSLQQGITNALPRILEARRVRCTFVRCVTDADLVIVAVEKLSAVYCGGRQYVVLVHPGHTLPESNGRSIRYTGVSSLVDTMISVIQPCEADAIVPGCHAEGVATA